MANVSIREVRKEYGKLEVIHGLSLEIAHNEFVVLVGPSGCGKSTMLRMIAGLEEITVGEIYIGSRFVNNVEPKNRNIAMVFQNYALYPHMTVFRNISFGLRAARLPKPEIEERVHEAAEILGLTELLDRKPSELSGGQRQRVSMGRAIVRNPEVFLFDEPLSNLDAKLRSQMRTEIKKLHQKVQTTIIYVTHDQIEAMTLADRIVIMREGYIQQIGAPKEVYHNPANTFVAGFIGSPAMNMLECRLERTNGHPFLRLADDLVLPIPREPRTSIPDGARVIMGIRPEDLTPENPHVPLPEEWRFQARVNVVEPLGAEAIVFLEVAGRELVGKSDGRDEPAAGQTMRFAFNLENLHIFDTETERSIY